MAVFIFMLSKINNKNSHGTNKSHRTMLKPQEKEMIRSNAKAENKGHAERYR